LKDDHGIDISRGTRPSSRTRKRCSRASH
jgi:hypothetical protein